MELTAPRIDDTFAKWREMIAKSTEAHTDDKRMVKSLEDWKPLERKVKWNWGKDKWMIYWMTLKSWRLLIEWRMQT